MASKKCQYCGAEIAENATRCYACKEWVTESQITFDDSKPREFIATALFAWFLGCFGIHRFFTGHIAIGIAQLLTMGGCGIWTLIDLLLICFNKFRDAQGRLLKNYDKNIGIVMVVIMFIPVVFVLLLILGIVFAVSLPVMLRG